MTALAQSLEPGCFGSFSIFSFNSPVCDKCRFRERCQPLAHDRLKRVKDMMQVTDLLVQHENEAAQRASASTDTREQLVYTGRPVELAQVALKVVRTTKVAKVSRVLTELQRKTLDRVPVKVEKRLRHIFETGKDMQIRADLANRVNPYNSVENRFMHKVCERLLAGGFTKTELRKTFQQDLGWSEGTAFAHVSVGVQVVQELGVARRDNDRFILSNGI